MRVRQCTTGPHVDELQYSKTFKCLCVSVSVSVYVCVCVCVCVWGGGGGGGGGDFTQIGSSKAHIITFCNPKTTSCYINSVRISGPLWRESSGHWGSLYPKKVTRMHRNSVFFAVGMEKLLKNSSISSNLRRQSRSCNKEEQIWLNPSWESLKLSYGDEMIRN